MVLRFLLVVSIVAQGSASATQEVDRVMPDVFWLSLAPIIASIGGLIVAIGTLVVSLRVSKATKEIHTLTNANFTALATKLALSESKVDALKDLVTSMTASASAARAATKEALVAAVSPPHPPPEVP